MNRSRKVVALMLGLSLLMASALVIRLDVSTAPGLLTSLRDGMSMSGGDADAVRRAADSLKSSSAALGAATLAVLSGDLEAAARHAHYALPTPGSIEAEYARVEHAPQVQLDRSR